MQGARPAREITWLTIGRQRMNLDDQRFVGSSNWRQNEVTFDAMGVANGIKDPYGSLGWTGSPLLGLDLLAATAIYRSFEAERVNVSYGIY